jgi:hypothetical protein
MNKINLQRAILGGLVAGVVLNIGEFLLNSVVLGPQMREYMARHNLPADPGTNFLVVAVLLTFVLGIVIVWIYAAMRPRLGPGPKTAICAGLLAWFCIYLYNGIINAMILQVPANALVIALVWGAVQYSIAAVAGAWLYTEA